MKEQLLCLLQAYINMKYFPGLVIINVHELTGSQIGQISFTADGFEIIRCAFLKNSNVIPVSAFLNVDTKAYRFMAIQDIQKELIIDLTKTNVF